MRPWKAVLGVGAACAACCAVPLVGGVASWTMGASALAAAASALLACADEFAPLATIASSKIARRCGPYGRATSVTCRASLSRKSPPRHPVPACRGMTWTLARSSPTVTGAPGTSLR